MDSYVRKDRVTAGIAAACAATILATWVTSKKTGRKVALSIGITGVAAASIVGYSLFQNQKVPTNKEIPAPTQGQAPAPSSTPGSNGDAPVTAGLPTDRLPSTRPNVFNQSTFINAEAASRPEASGGSIQPIASGINALAQTAIPQASQAFIEGQEARMRQENSATSDEQRKRYVSEQMSASGLTTDGSDGPSAEAISQQFQTPYTQFPSFLTPGITSGNFFNDVAAYVPRRTPDDVMQASQDLAALVAGQSPEMPNGIGSQNGYVMQEASLSDHFGDMRVQMELMKDPNQRRQEQQFSLANQASMDQMAAQEQMRLENSDNYKQAMAHMDYYSRATQDSQRIRDAMDENYATYFAKEAERIGRSQPAGDPWSSYLTSTS